MLMFSVVIGAIVRQPVLKLTTGASASLQSLRFPSVFQSSFPDLMISPNNLLETNRGPGSALGARQRFGRAVHRPGCRFRRRSLSKTLGGIIRYDYETVCGGIAFSRMAPPGIYDLLVVCLLSEPGQQFPICRVVALCFWHHVYLARSGDHRMDYCCSWALPCSWRQTMRSSSPNHRTALDAGRASCYMSILSDPARVSAGR